MDSIKYTIVIPTLNERDNILILIKQLEALFPEALEIIVVDEHSTDGTYETVKEYSEGKDNISCHLNTESPGLSPSIVKGFDLAKGEYLCCMDGDLQHDESFLPRLFEAAVENDLVIGSRYTDDGGFAQKWTVYRKLTSRIATLLTKILLHLEVKDPMSGFFVVKKTAYSDIRQQLNPKGFKIMLEILFYLKHSDKNYSIREIGIFFRDRIHGKSKLSSKVIIQFLRMLLELRKKRNAIISSKRRMSKSD